MVAVVVIFKKFFEKKSINEDTISTLQVPLN